MSADINTGTGSTQWQKRTRGVTTRGAGAHDGPQAPLAARRVLGRRRAHRATTSSRRVRVPAPRVPRVAVPAHFETPPCGRRRRTPTASALPVPPDGPFIRPAPQRRVTRPLHGTPT